MLKTVPNFVLGHAVASP